MIIHKTKSSAKKIEPMLYTLSSALYFNDNYKLEHGKKVASLAFKLGQSLNFPPPKLQILKIAGLVHDIGLLNIPYRILNKPGKLSPAQFEIVKEHPVKGYKLLENSSFAPDVKTMVLQHHERLDGSGYPEGRTEKDITLETQILTVADVMAALTSPRAYRKHYNVNEALQILKKERGQKYNQQIVNNCIELFKKQGFSW